MAQSPVAHKPKGTSVRAILVAGVVGLVVGAAGVGVLWVQDRNRAAEASDNMRAQVDTLEGQRAALVARNAYLRGRVHLARALHAHQQQNFGVARSEAEQAAAALGPVPDAEAVVTRIRALDLDISGNFDDQRRLLLALSEQLDSSIEAKAADPG